MSAPDVDNLLSIFNIDRVAVNISAFYWQQDYVYEIGIGSEIVKWEGDEARLRNNLLVYF